MSNYFPSDSIQYNGHGRRPPQAFNQSDQAGMISPTEPNPWYTTENTQQPPTPPKSASEAASRTTTGKEQVKHRRTRSGCYTCRSRRVKCDEGRPTCERCKKGSRECVYPEPRPNTKTTTKLGQVREVVEQHESSSDAYEDEDQDISSMQSDRPPAAEQSQKRAASGWRRSRARSTKMIRKQSLRSLKNVVPSIENIADGKEKSLSPSTDDSGNPSTSHSLAAELNRSDKFSSVSTTTSQDPVPWSHLPSDLQTHLDFHQQLTYHYWFFKHDATYFLHTIMVEHALKYDPLLYAVIGFAAFLKTLRNHEGKIQDFLGYYNKSVTLLRRSLADGQKHTDATLLTILQLATFEEYLGDWANLFGHQKAAYGILLELYSPETIMETEVRRKILSWYSRLDLFAGLMAGHSTVLGRDWFCASHAYYRSQVLKFPENINYKIEGAVAGHRLVAVDLAMLFAKLPRGEISMTDFMRENKSIAERIKTWMNPMNDLLADKTYVVNSFERPQDQDLDDIVDPYVPGDLLRGDLWSVNFMRLDWIGVELMHKHQTALLLRQEPPPEMQSLALDICRQFETIEYWPESTPGALLSTHGTIGIAVLHLPKDEKHVMWCRQKLAKIEGMGYIYPPTFRRKMAELWGLPELLHWWLPNDEGYPPIVRSIRSFIEDRPHHLQPQSEDMRNMKAIFSKMSLHADATDSAGATGQDTTHAL